MTIQRRFASIVLALLLLSAPATAESRPMEITGRALTIIGALQLIGGLIGIAIGASGVACLKFDDTCSAVIVAIGTGVASGGGATMIVGIPLWAVGARRSSPRVSLAPTGLRVSF
jgi:hypothetical protein